MTRRLIRMKPDRRQPVWQTRFIDVPLFWEWSASVLALPLIVPCAAVLGVARLTGVLPEAAFGVGQSAAAAYGLGAVLAAWGTWGERQLILVREHELEIAGLAPQFDGYCIAQLSDLHIGNFDHRRRALRWVHKANALEPDLVVVTGDLVTSGTEFYPDVAEVLAELRAPDGVLCILGNHDQWDDARCRAALEARGLVVLTNTLRVLERGGAQLTIAGLDDPFTGKADLAQTLEGRPPGVPVVLLSHYPDWFEAASRLGVQLVLSGHTHGGQLGIPLLAERFNLATLVGLRSRGLFTHGSSKLYVSAGLGTTGPPLRLGVPPEIAVFRLRAPGT